MKIHHSLEPSHEERPLVLAIGFFDGLHRGHREIIRALLRMRRPGYRAAALTFRNHPATHLRPDKIPALITTVEERVDLLASTGIDELYLVPFDERIATLPARDFLVNVLFERLGVRAVVIGQNFRFGHGRGGDASLARELLGPRGVEVVAVPPLVEDGESISSTRIRDAIRRGDMSMANRLLGLPYALRGNVMLGAGRGHDLGFPTANLAIPAQKTLPADGVYACVARYDGRDYSALLSIGTNPTFSGAERTVETWLLDFHRTLYGEELTLRELRFIRPQRAFATADALREQMAQDATHVGFPSFTTA